MSNMPRTKKSELISHDIVPAIRLTTPTDKTGWMVLYKGMSLFFMDLKSINDLKEIFPRAFYTTILEITDRQYDYRVSLDS